MSIDWFTLVAQLVNFVVLVILLRMFLYEPVMQAMAKREEEIARRHREADESLLAADEKLADLENRTRQVEDQRDQLLEEARREAEEMRQKLMAESRQAVEASRRHWFETLNRERKKVLDGFRLQVGELAEETARQTLQTLAGEELEQRIEKEFLRRLQMLPPDEFREIGSHLAPGSELEALVSSAYPLSTEVQDELRELLERKLDRKVEMEFAASADVICGIELEIAGFHFGWNVKEHLRNLALNYGEALSKTTAGSSRFQEPVDGNKDG